MAISKIAGFVARQAVKGLAPEPDLTPPKISVTATVKVTGTEKVLRNLNLEMKKIKRLTKSRLYACGLLVKNRAVKITPIKTGNLRGSAYVTPIDTAAGPQVEIGYTAYYAPYVHEMPEDYNYTKAGTGPKFLERGLKQAIGEINKILGGKMV